MPDVKIMARITRDSPLLVWLIYLLFQLRKDPNIDIGMKLT